MEPKIKVAVAPKTYTAFDYTIAAIFYGFLLFGFVSCSYNAFKPYNCDQARAMEAEAKQKSDQKLREVQSAATEDLEGARASYAVSMYALNDAELKTIKLCRP